MTVPVWVVPVLLAWPFPVGVLAGHVAHWIAEARALRPAYLAEKRATASPGG